MSNSKEIEEKKDQMVREIIRANALEGEWIPMNGEFHSGDVMGFDVAGVRVRATVEFDKYGFVVKMTSPVKCSCSKDIYHRRQSFFTRNPPGASLFVGGVEGGPATQRCLDGAKEVLIGLYTDWVVLRRRREAVRRKLAGFADYAVSFVAGEKARTAPVRQKIRELSALSGQLKQRFKRGEMTQEDYVRQRQPLHDEIVSLMSRTHERDPFVSCFSQELEDCQYVMNKREFIESI